jgi:hypothetical protein
MISAPEKVEPHESKHRSHAENAIYGSVTRQATQYIWFYISLNACVPLIKMHKKTTPKGVAQTGRPSAAETKKARRKALPENSITAKAA